MAVSSVNGSISSYFAQQHLSYGVKLKNPVLIGSQTSSSERSKRRRSNTSRSQISCFNAPDKPILKEAFKEPVAFVGGLVAGLLRLDLNEDPLKEWVTRNVEAAGIREELDPQSLDAREEEETPQQIEIE